METITADPRLDRARRLLDAGDHSLDALGAAVGLGPPLAAAVSGGVWVESGRVPRAEEAGDAEARAARQGDVTRALYEAGYGSSSRVYEDGAARLGMLPGDYRRGGEGLEIRWTIIDTELGQALVAATERGLCAIALGDDAAALEAELRARVSQGRAEPGRRRPRRIPGAARARGRAAAERQAGQGRVELIGTAFQQRVWQALMRIPPRPDAELRATRRRARHPARRARDRARLRAEPARGDRALPPHRARRRFARRLSLGPAAQGSPAKIRAVSQLASRHGASRAKVLLALLAVYVLWGSTYYAIADRAARLSAVPAHRGAHVHRRQR